ncbi:S-layer homology domain-containing protein [Brevibacillus laterosporus]|nr:S-layer homology domain-containing protein [Brevibacillus laterosporus]
MSRKIKIRNGEGKIEMRVNRKSWIIIAIALSVVGGADVVQAGAYARDEFINHQELISSKQPLVKSTVKQKDYAKHWAEKEIDMALQNKWLGNYSDGKFRPDEPITQSQFLSALVSLHQLKEKQPHPETAKSWAKDAYEKVAKAGWMTPDIKINPDQGITRYEAAAWITNAWGHKQTDVFQYTYQNNLLLSSNKFVNGLYQPNGKLAMKSMKFVQQTALMTDSFTRAEAAHTLKLISTKIHHLNECNSWIDQIQKSLTIKSGKLTGKVPGLPDVLYVKQASLIQNIDGEIKELQDFSIDPKGKLIFGATFDSNTTVLYEWKLPNLTPQNVLDLSFDDTEYLIRNLDAHI